MQTAPRIYNLFPLLVGEVEAWQGHLPRIAAMGFDWVYLNPFHSPGFSGSLYAVKDYYEINPLFRGGSPAPAAEILRGFTRAAADHGLKCMMDLVINHTAKDSVLVADHPQWFARDDRGDLVSPSAIDADQPGGMVRWGDLALLRFTDARLHAPIAAFFAEVALHHLRLGFAGFRCDAAYQVPPAVWRSLITPVKQQHPDAVFAAETLGGTPEQTVSLAGTGFDFLFSSAKWWDLQADWFFRQYDQCRRLAPSIAFPESHDTERLAAAAGLATEAEARARRKVLLALFAAAGWMMPIGFEFGFRRRLDVVTSRPADWEEPWFDLSGWIAGLNGLKAAIPALVEEGRMERLSAPDDSVVMLVRCDHDGQDRVTLLVNRGAEPASAEIHGEPMDLTSGQPLPADPRLLLAPGEARLLWDALKKVRCAGVAAEFVPRIIIEAVSPELDGGRYPVKRLVGDRVEVAADIFTEGHQRLAARLLYKGGDDSQWRETPLAFLGNDRWQGAFTAAAVGPGHYTLEAWVDRFETWRERAEKKAAAGHAMAVELVEGAALVDLAMGRALGEHRERLRLVVEAFAAAEDDTQRLSLLMSNLLRRTMAECPDRSLAVRYGRVLEVTVDRREAGFAAWYEMFPRSQGSRPGQSASFADCRARLPEIAAMGFDVVYLVPVHPIGRVLRKGTDNTLIAGPGDPGSPYAIGSPEGGHDAIDPELGTLDDFRAFIDEAKRLGLQVAMDLAVQCAPDHPWVGEHPEWFQIRADRTIRHAENPPKLYQDIVNLDFDGAAADSLWQALLAVVRFWIGQGVEIFRVDNPHTKPLPFWEWLIATVRRSHPRVLFLAEAFTRPKMMKMLAKLGFSQSYTYFTWRNTKEELTEYLTELTQSEMCEYFRPHFFTNTPDILPLFLQVGGRAAFRIRLVLAATLSPLYGIYNGFELCEAEAVPGTEEYLHSEKYQYKVWDWQRSGHIKDDITRLNAIRRANPPLQRLRGLVFHRADDDSVLFYEKSAGRDRLFIAVNLDPFDARDADLHFPLADLGIGAAEPFEVEDLLGRRRHLWRGAVHRLRLDPQVNPAAILKLTVWPSVSWREPCL